VRELIAIPGETPAARAARIVLETLAIGSKRRD